MLSTRNKSFVIVSGGSSGIGENIVETLLKETQHTVISISRTGKKEHPRLINIAHDFSKEMDALPKKIIPIIEKGFIAALINNVGKSSWKSMSDINHHFFQELMNINVYSAIELTKLSIPHMKKGSAVINISSIAGKRGTANNSIYCATKFAMEGLLRVWTVEFGKLDIRVNNICPVLIETEGLRDALEERSAPGRVAGASTFIDNFARNQSPLGRLPEVADVSGLLIYLISPQACSITGQSINIDCGVFPG